MKSYKPCEIIEFSIIVDNPKWKYLGLLAYFENDQGEKLGSWVLPSEVAASGGETIFNTCNNGAAVMHANAATKHYKHTFRYQAPVEGSGALTLRVLIKHGITNGNTVLMSGVTDIMNDDATNTDCFSMFRCFDVSMFRCFQCFDVSMFQCFVTHRRCFLLAGQTQHKYEHEYQHVPQ